MTSTVMYIVNLDQILRFRELNPQRKHYRACAMATLFGRRLLQTPVRIGHRPFSKSSACYSTPAPQPGWWEVAKARFKDAPVSHVVSFAMLHELTAIVPFALILFTLQTTDITVKISDELRGNAAEKLNRYFDKKLSKADDETTNPGYTVRVIRFVKGNDRLFINTIITYAIVKVTVVTIQSNLIITRY